MTNPLGTADFFALEAGECLDRLETLVGRPDGPPADEFLRTARVLRGSALMAGQQPIAQGGRRPRGARPGVPRRTASVGSRHSGACRAGGRGVPPVWCAGSANGARRRRRARCGLGLSLESLAGRDRRGSRSAAREPQQAAQHRRSRLRGARGRADRERPRPCGPRPPGLARRSRAALHRHPPHAVAPGPGRAERARAAAGDPRRHRAGGGDPRRPYAPPPGSTRSWPPPPRRSRWPAPTSASSLLDRWHILTSGNRSGHR